jgi:hypothetical protein
MSTELEKISQSLFSYEVKEIAKIKIKTYVTELEVKLFGTAKEKTKCILQITTNKGTEYFAYESGADLDIHSIVKSPNKNTWIKQRVSELFMDAEYFASDLLPKLKNIVDERNFEHIAKLETPDEYSAMSRSRR